jgi:hypothetical protein
MAKLTGNYFMFLLHEIRTKRRSIIKVKAERFEVLTVTSKLLSPAM